MNEQKQKKAARERKKREKEIRQDIRRRKEALKTLSDYTKEAQTAFNRFIRQRDQLAGKPCISCLRPPGEIEGNQRWKAGGAWDCGHYLSVGSHPELRFCEDNAHRQCKQCNRDKSGNAGRYRVNLINRIGQDRVDYLEGPHEPKRYRKEELKQIRDKYRRLYNEIKTP